MSGPTANEARPSPLPITDLLFYNRRSPVPDPALERLVSQIGQTSAEWINRISPYTSTYPPVLHIRVGDYNTSSPVRWASAKQSRYLNGLPFEGPYQVLRHFAGTTNLRAIRMARYLATLDEGMAGGESESGADQTGPATERIPLLKYADLVYSPYRIVFKDADGKIMSEDEVVLDFDRDVGVNAVLNGIIWMRYYRYMLDREVGAWWSPDTTPAPAPDLATAAPAPATPAASPPQVFPDYAPYQATHPNTLIDGPSPSPSPSPIPAIAIRNFVQAQIMVHLHLAVDLIGSSFRSFPSAPADGQDGKDGEEGQDKPLDVLIALKPKSRDFFATQLAATLSG